MDKELTDKLNESGAQLLDWLKGAAESGGDFVAEQAPLLATEIVAWHFWSSVFLAVATGLFAAMLGIVSWRLLVYAQSAPEGSADSGHPRFAFPLIVGCLAGLIAVMTIPIEVIPRCYEATKAAVAPRIVIIEYAGKALGGDY